MGVYIKGMTLDEAKWLLGPTRENEIIEVKAPHGDLIDRGELQNRVSDEYRAWDDDYDALQILGDIEDAPTVIENEVE